MSSFMERHLRALYALDESVDDLKLVNSGLIQSGSKSNTLTGATTITNTINSWS